MHTLVINTISNHNLYIFKNNELIIQQKFTENVKAGDYASYYLQMLNKRMQLLNLTFNHINKIAVFCGPSYFTAVRIGVSMANTIAYAINVPIIIAINNIEFFNYFANSLKDIAKYNYVIISLDIGKNGAIICVFKNNNVVLAPIYIAAEDINTYLTEYLQNNSIIVGNKIDLFTVTGNYVIITANPLLNNGLIGTYVSNINNSNCTLPIQPNYIKEPDILIKNN